MAPGTHTRRVSPMSTNQPYRRRWIVKYDARHGCWCAWPHDWPLVRGAWAFSTWEDAFAYAQSNGKAKHIKRTSPIGL